MDEFENFYSDSYYLFQKDKKFYSEWCVNDDLKIIFITINKCAGSTLREYLPSKNFIIVDNNFIDDTYVNDKIFKNYKFYACIREPGKRYISALSEFIKQSHKNYNIDISDEKFRSYIINNLCNGRYIFDEHSLPQISSLQKVLKNNK